MNENTNNQQPLVKSIHQMLNLVFVLLAIIVALIVLLIRSHSTQPITTLQTDTISEPQQGELIGIENQVLQFWKAPSTDLLNTDPNKELILYGKKLITNTSDFFGPQGTLLANSTNGMNCQNCHLDAGTKVFGNNYSAVASTYPKYRARSGTKEDITKRINDCFERSLNGKALDENSKEMKAITAYIKWLGNEVPKGTKPEGSGLKNISYLERAASPENGKLVYTEKCQNCHQSKGEGQFNENKTAYVYPPLWGPNSYNTGAGLYRISNLAKFAKYNMPLGSSHENTTLSDEEAWDVAAYINSLPHPIKDTKNDWPKKEEKPFDHPFGPYADDFTEQQHKYGPFIPIIKKQEEIKNSNF